MGFFINRDSKVKIYFNDKLEISKKETPLWVEIVEEPSFELLEKIKKGIKPKKLSMNIAENKSVKLDLDTESMNNIPLNILSELIIEWSEKEKPQENVLKTRVSPVFIGNLWNEILNRYGLGSAENVLGIM